MKEHWFRDYIIEDRESRKFLNFNGESWFEEFMKLKNQEVIQNSYFFDKLSVDETLFTFRDDANELCSTSRFFWEYDFPNLAEIERYVNEITFSKEILDLLISLNSNILRGFLYKYKSYYFGNMQNKEAIREVNLILIRMMDYFIEKCAFEHFSCVVERLEYEFIILWFELTKEKVEKIIEENIDNPELLYIFMRITKSEDFTKLFKKENIFMLEKTSSLILYKLLYSSRVPKEYVCNEYFLHAFSKFELEEQIYISELLQEKEYDFCFIKQLHELLNKDETFDKKQGLFLYNVFEMSQERLEQLCGVIEKSSYFSKFDVRNSNLWKIIEELDNSPNIDISHDYYSDIMDLYYKCREYATSSIVEALYPLNNLTCKVTHIQCEPFNILARVRTIWEAETLEDTFKARHFCSFSILTERNVSHYGNDILYGYYANVSKDSIAHISPIDSLSVAGAIYEKDLTKKVNMLLDIEDLNQATLECRTYNQLCIRTKGQNGDILWPDCIICIDKIDEKSQKVADKLSLNIVVIHKNSDTIENNDDIFEHLN